MRIADCGLRVLVVSLIASACSAGEWRVTGPYAERFVREEGALCYEARIYIENQTDHFTFFKIACKHGPAAGPTTGVREWQGFCALDAKEGTEVPIKLQGVQTENTALTIELRDRVAPDRVLFHKTHPVLATYSRIQIKLLRPCYRDTIFASQDLKSITFRLDFDLAEDALRDRSATVRLTREGAERPTFESKIERLQRGMTADAPVSGLPDGKYVLSVELPEGTKGTKIVRKLPRLEGEAWIDENQVLHIDGKPFLPFGWFSCLEEDFPLVAKQGCTAVQDYNALYRARKEELGPYLDKVRAAGLKVTFYPYPTSRYHEPEVWGQPLSEEEADEIRQYVRSYKTHPALLAWYMADEPELRPALVERCKRIYDVVAEEDPYHPCIMLNDTLDGIFKYESGGDILMPDPYPLFLIGGHAQRGIDHVSNFLAAVHKAVKNEKPAWVTPQAFRSSNKGNRTPNFTELRNMAYQALAHNAKGFLWYTYRTTKNFPEVGIGMPYLVREIMAIKEAVLAPPAGVPIQIAPEDAPVHCDLRRVGDRVYLFAVNTATEPVDVRFTVPGLTQPSLSVGSEGREVQIADDSFADHFDLYEAHLYTNDPNVKSLPLIKDIKAEIAAAVAALKKPGNLAFEDTGTIVTVSSASRYGSQPCQVIDGNEAGMLWRDGTPRKYPDWIQLTFQNAQEVSRVVVFTDCVRDFQIQVKVGAEWNTVAEVTGNTAERIEKRFDPVTTEAVRLWVTASNDEQWSRISEIEVYKE